MHVCLYFIYRIEWQSIMLIDSVARETLGLCKQQGCKRSAGKSCVHVLFTLLRRKAPAANGMNADASRNSTDATTVRSRQSAQRFVVLPCQLVHSTRRCLVFDFSFFSSGWQAGPGEAQEKLLIRQFWYLSCNSDKAS